MNIKWFVDMWRLGKFALLVRGFLSNLHFDRCPGSVRFDHGKLGTIAKVTSRFSRGLAVARKYLDRLLQAMTCVINVAHRI